MSAKGTATFIAQRASAVVLLPLTAWLAWSLAAHTGGGYNVVRDWLASPLNAGLLAAFIVFAAFHMRIGISEILHDYIHGSLRGVLSALNWLLCAAAALAALWAAYTLAFAG